MPASGIRRSDRRRAADDGVSASPAARGGCSARAGRSRTAERRRRCLRPAGARAADRHRARPTLQRRVEFANPAAGAIFGFDAERALGSHAIEAIPNIEVERRIDDALRGEASVAPLTLTGAEGQRVYRVSVYPLMGEDRSCDGVVVLRRRSDRARAPRPRRAKSFSPTFRTSCARRCRRSS